MYNVNVPSNTILFLANVPNPDGPIDLSTQTDADSIQVLQDTAVLDLSIDLNHNIDETEEGIQMNVVRFFFQYK